MRVINTVLLSFGMSGKVFHARFLNIHPGFKLRGAWERTSKSISSQYPGALSYGSLVDVLKDPNVELVVVNTPTATHAAFATQALHAGKHVIVEKAFASNAAEAIQVSNLSVEQNLKLSVFQNRRWDSDFKTVQQILSTKVLGEIVEASIAYERYNLTLSPKIHKETPGPGSGNLLDLGPHCVDQALVLFGLPEAVFADIRICRPGSKVDDFFDIQLNYPTLRVRLKSSYLVREPGPGYTLHGTLGSFVKTRADVQETQLRAGMSPGHDTYGFEPSKEYGVHTNSGTQCRIESLRGNYMEFYDQMHEAIVADKRVPVTPEEGVNVMRVIDAAFESSKSGGLVRLK